MNSTTVFEKTRKLFDEIIISLIEGKYRRPECRGIPLGNIHFCITRTGIGYADDPTSGTGIPNLQQIAKIQGTPGEKWQTTAQRMLDLFCDIGEIEKVSDKIYKLNTGGTLYRDLRKEIAS